MKIAAVGTGYVGLVAGTCLAETGNDVVCLDIDEEKVARLSRGEIPLYEPGLDELIRRNVADGRLRFSTDVACLADRAVVFICVQTPQGEDGSVDLRHVLDAARDATHHCPDDALLVLKSTVPVGTNDRVRTLVHEELGPDTKIEVVSNPEFLKEGAAVDDFLRPDRIVIGTDSERARDIMKDLYAPLVRTEKPVLFMDPRSAELTKYAANALLATRISFMNDIARLCDEVGADVDLVRKGVGADARIGYPFLFPGTGYGGSCFPKDVRALLCMARENDLSFPLLEGCEATNATMKSLLVERARKHFGGLSGHCFTLWGLAFKPRTDDVREAPALAIARALVEGGATVRATDPAALQTGRAALEDLGSSVTFHENNYECLEGSDGLFLVTEWNEFRRPDFERMRSLMRTPVVFDGRNIYDPPRMRALGFEYYGIGRR